MTHNNGITADTFENLENAAYRKGYTDAVERVIALLQTELAGISDPEGKPDAASTWSAVNDQPPANATPLSELHFSARTFNCLVHEKIETIEQLATWSEKDLLKIPNFGPKCLQEVAEKLVEHAHLRPTTSDTPDIWSGYSPEEEGVEAE